MTTHQYPQLSQEKKDEIKHYINSGAFHKEIAQQTVDTLLNRKLSENAQLVLKLANTSMLANRQFFKREKQGFIPKLMDKIYTERSVAKKKMLAAEQRIEVINAELARRNVGGHK